MMSPTLCETTGRTGADRSGRRVLNARARARVNVMVNVRLRPLQQIKEQVSNVHS
eukprot:m.166455 g.166455  ORF g.166455 m.166455 type:complete len:55 (-) comp17171_c0_seq1:20-184(-)